MPISPYDPKDFAALERLDTQEDETGRFEITIKVAGAARVNRLLSWIVRSHAYDDVASLSVAVIHEEAERESA